MTSGDWRLTNQETYLLRAELTRRPWRETRPGWDHDHCEFCGAKFGPAGALREGWTTRDEYHWICDGCFRDFREQFDWRVTSD